MAWFDYLGGIAGGLGQVGSEMQAQRDKQVQEKRQAAQDARLAAEEQRRVVEFEQQQAERDYANLEPGTELDVTDPMAQRLLKYNKRTLGAGTSAGKVKVLETPERLALRNQQDLAGKKYKAEVEKFGEAEALQRRANDLQNQLTNNPKKAEQILSGLPRTLRAQLAGVMGVKSEDLMTRAERLAETNLTPTVVAAYANQPGPWRTGGGYVINDRTGEVRLAPQKPAALPSGMDVEKEVRQEMAQWNELMRTSAQFREQTLRLYNNDFQKARLAEEQRVRQKLQSAFTPAAYDITEVPE